MREKRKKKKNKNKAESDSDVEFLSQEDFDTNVKKSRHKRRRRQPYSWGLDSPPRSKSKSRFPNLDQLLEPKQEGKKFYIPFLLFLSWFSSFISSSKFHYLFAASSSEGEHSLPDVPPVQDNLAVTGAAPTPLVTSTPEEEDDTPPDLNGTCIVDVDGMLLEETVENGPENVDIEGSAPDIGAYR